MMSVIKKMVSFLSAFVMACMMVSYLPTFADEEYSDDQIAEMINEVAILVNEAREEAGLKPVYVLPYLNEVSEIRAVESTMQFSHSRRDGSGFETSIDTDIVSYGTAFENLAGGTDNAEDTFNQWRNSPKHWAAIMNPDITHMGVGFAYDPDSVYHWYWQQTFVSTNQDFADQYLPSDTVIATEEYGDINGDNIVDTFDYILLTDYIRKRNSDYPVYFNNDQLRTADCFSDGIISEADAKVLTRYILGEYTSLPFVF